MPKSVPRLTAVWAAEGEEAKSQTPSWRPRGAQGMSLAGMAGEEEGYGRMVAAMKRTTRQAMQLDVMMRS